MQPVSGNVKGELLLAAVELMERAGRSGMVRVVGESMLPTLRPGQMLSVDFAPERLRCGDLLVFRQDGTLVVHRLLGDARPLDGRRRLRTRGDGAVVFDPAVERSAVVGRVLAFERDGCWRSTRGAAARAYARCLAWHDLFWAVVGVVVREPERRLRRIGLRIPLGAAVAGTDRALSGLVHRALFCWAHRKLPRPDAVE